MVQPKAMSGNGNPIWVEKLLEAACSNGQGIRHGKITWDITVVFCDFEQNNRRYLLSLSAKFNSDSSYPLSCILTSLDKRHKDRQVILNSLFVMNVIIFIHTNFYDFFFFFF